jgi:hypothetical protein
MPLSVHAIGRMGGITYHISVRDIWVRGGDDRLQVVVAMAVAVIKVSGHYQRKCGLNLKK